MIDNAVIIPDPDNERGVRAINPDTGKIIAYGYLTCDIHEGEKPGSVATVNFVSREKS